jgi:hypothetical protein
VESSPLLEKEEGMRMADLMPIAAIGEFNHSTMAVFIFPKVLRRYKYKH